MIDRTRLEVRLMTIYGPGSAPVAQIEASTNLDSSFLLLPRATVFDMEMNHLNRVYYYIQFYGSFKEIHQELFNQI